MRPANAFFRFTPILLPTTEWQKEHQEPENHVQR